MDYCCGNNCYNFWVDPTQYGRPAQLFWISVFFDMLHTYIQVYYVVGKTQHITRVKIVKNRLKLQTIKI